MPTTPDLNTIIEDAEKAVREGAYVTVGLGVLAFQRAQVRRREILERIGQGGTPLGAFNLDNLKLDNLKLDGDAVRRLREQVRGSVAELSSRGEQLTGQLGGVSKAVTGNAEAARAQVVDLFKTVDDAIAPARRRWDEQVASIEGRLPSSARSVVGTVRAAAESGEEQFRAAVGLDPRTATTSAAS